MYLTFNESSFVAGTADPSKEFPLKRYEFGHFGGSSGRPEPEGLLLEAVTLGIQFDRGCPPALVHQDVCSRDGLNSVLLLVAQDRNVLQTSPKVDFVHDHFQF